MQSLLRILAVMNLAFVLLMLFGPAGLFYPAVFTALLLFVYDIQDSSRTLRFIGALFNFIGVVAGGIGNLKSVMAMALIGAIFLVIDHLSPVSKAKADENDG